MKALTVCQPWAWAIIEGHKRVENRPRRTLYRGPLLIHAGKSRAWWADGCTFLRKIGIVLPEKKEIAWGAIIGQVNLTGCVRKQEIDDPFAFGPWCWLLADSQKFERPISYKGHLGLFEVDLAQVRGQLLPLL